MNEENPNMGTANSAASESSESHANTPVSAQPEAPQPAESPAVNNTEHSKLPGIKVLFSDTWQLYVSRLKPSILLQLLNLAVIIATFAIGALVAVGLQKALSNSGFIIIVGILVVAVVVAMVFYMIWVQAAQVLILDMPAEEVGVKAALKKTKPLIVPLFVVAILQFLVLSGAFVLFIVPALILALYLNFTIYVTLIEGRRGMDALLVSKEYIRGYWWATLGRLILLVLTAIVISIISGIITGALQPVLKEGVGIISYLVNIVVTPFYVAFVYVLYRHFKNMKGQVAVPETGRTLFKVLAWLGPIVIVLAIVLGSLSIFNAIRNGTFSEGARRDSDYELNLEQLKNLEKLQQTSPSDVDDDMPVNTNTDTQVQ